jgi:hypothetical protein
MCGGLLLHVGWLGVAVALALAAAGLALGRYGGDDGGA